ncbi:hypothetical protein A4R26_05415 [Niastella populi]|uniref:Uncharacterized protein n=1 Tax=Niastella populi TaxID=550983 RepID=A0A1V9FE13_9BACT|nr:hypothetical protein A4R26_05415 [Niastella populi]
MLTNKVMVSPPFDGVFATRSFFLKWLFFTVWKVIHEERKITDLPVYSVRMKRHDKIRKPDFEKRLEGVSGAGFNLGILS